MLSFARSTALELAEHKTRVNCIAPDHTTTPGSSGQRSDPVDETKWRQHSADEISATNRIVPLGREGILEECANAAVFLASRMSDYVAGVTLPVAGGTWASSGWLRAKEGGGRTLNERIKFSL
jgi:NAD(P)-dependent dehydrogenase (short-subunit alcohol dehydrogenase family)